MAEFKELAPIEFKLIDQSGHEHPAVACWRCAALVLDAYRHELWHDGKPFQWHTTKEQANG